MAECVRALYIHIPFCRKKCAYCDFVSFEQKEELIPAYITALCSELSLMPSRTLDTIYIGGGTPSLLEPELIGLLFSAIKQHFIINHNAEITIEINPESASFSKLEAYRRAGINRLSIGVQSLREAQLAWLGRAHTVPQCRAVFAEARSMGFDNISVDLMYGLPGLGVQEWEQTLEEIIVLSPEHISLYHLTVEEHTPLFLQKISVDDDAAGEQYVHAVEQLNKNGYKRYEISNFAKLGKEARHNITYWDCEPYDGAGAGAVGCCGNVRRRNLSDVEQYIHRLQTGERVLDEKEVLSGTLKIKEKFFLGLRKAEGIICGPEEDALFHEKLELFVTRGLLRYDPPRLMLSDQGMLLANQIWRSIL